MQGVKVQGFRKKKYQSPTHHRSNPLPRCLISRNSKIRISVSCAANYDAFTPLAVLMNACLVAMSFVS